MAQLPAPPTLTLAAIWAHYEANQETGFREHLGASLIGAECTRQIWYSWRWTTKARHSGRLLRLFATGNLAEARFIADLRAAGVEVLDIDPETGKQWQVRDESGHFGGSMDAVCVGLPEAPKTWHCCEFKTHNTKSFVELANKGVQQAKPQHFAQMQVYMHLTGMERAVYLAVNKNDDDLYLERVHYDAAFALRLVAKAHAIIASPQPPERISADPAWFQCRFCDHAAQCHTGKLPEAHCRSCLHSTPTDGGQWVCEAEGKHLTVEDQMRGCPRHLYIPGLVHGEQVDADRDGLSITYAMPDGTRWTDGIPF